MVSFIGSTTTTSTVQKVPAGVMAGDLLLAHYSYYALTSVTAPGGWSVLQSATASGSVTETVWYRVATSGDTPGTTYTWSFSATAYESGAMLAYRGVDTSILPDGFCDNSGASATPALCSFSNANSNDTYVGFFALDATGFVLPGDLGNRGAVAFAGYVNLGSGAGDKRLGAAGTIAADSGALGSSGAWASVVLALKPLGSGPTPAPTAAPAVVSFIGSTTTTSTSQKVPAGVIAGDLLLAHYSYYAPVTAAAPSGWTKLQSATLAGSTAETVWYRVATSGDTPGSTYTWNFSGTAYEAGAMLAYGGVDTSVLPDGFCDNSGTSTTPSLCSFSNANSNDTYVGFFALNATGGFGLPGDLNNRGSVADVGYVNLGSAAGDKQLGAAGTIGSDSGALGSSGAWASVVLALKPLGSSGPTPSPGAPTATPTATPAVVSYIGSTTTTSKVQTVPAGVIAGDLLLAHYSYYAPITATAPSGWTQLQSATLSGSVTEKVWYRVATGGDTPGSTYTWSFSGTAYEAGAMLAYGGVDTSVLPDGFCDNSGTSIVPSLCSFSNANSNDTYVGFFALNSTGTFGLPGDLSNRGSVADVGYVNVGSAAGDKRLGAAGTIAADSGTPSSSGAWATVVLALKPL